MWYLAPRFFKRLFLRVGQCLKSILMGSSDCCKTPPTSIVFLESCQLHFFIGSQRVRLEAPIKNPPTRAIFFLEYLTKIRDA